MRCRAHVAVLAAAAVVALPAAAQQPLPTWAPLSYPTDSGKPVVFDPQYAAKAESDRRLGCAAGSPCRWQLLGVIQNNGVVELQATALKW